MSYTSTSSTTIFSPVKMGALEVEVEEEPETGVGRGNKWGKKEVSIVVCLLVCRRYVCVILPLHMFV